MMAEADGLKAQIDRIERADDLAAEQLEAMRNAAERNGTDVDEERERVLLVDGAFNTWMRRGPGALNEAQRRSMRSASRRLRTAARTRPPAGG
jgi:HK97 family phage major capsid protein